MSRARALGEWTVTGAHVRALALAALAIGMAVWMRRVDLVILGAPLAAIAAWGELARPRTDPTAVGAFDATTLREGQEVTATVAVEGVPPTCDTIVTMSDAAWLARTPARGIVVAQPDEPVQTVGAVDRRMSPDAAHSLRARAAFRVRSLRWGSRLAGTLSVGASSPWHAYRVGPTDLPATRTVTVPLPSVFETTAPAPHPHGVVGINRSSRRGSGSEFATIRPFSPGDRLRRIHWPTSLRTNVLHATSTHSDEDAHIVLLVDAFSDIGPHEGIDGRPTSLDQTVRAAGAIAEHFLSRGDRLSVRTVGAADVPRLPTGTGMRHLRLVLENLAHIAPATERHDDGERAIHRLDSNALAIVLSPLIEPRMVEVISVVASRGVTTVVVDCFPDHLVSSQAGDDSVHSALAWRLRLLERDTEVSMLRRHGVPVVPWRGPGSLDTVLRDINRQRATPRSLR